MPVSPGPRTVSTVIFPEGCSLPSQAREPVEKKAFHLMNALGGTLSKRKTVDELR
jgi:hypothetical protein